MLVEIRIIFLSLFFNLLFFVLFVVVFYRSYLRKEGRIGVLREMEHAPVVICVAVCGRTD